MWHPSSLAKSTSPALQEAWQTLQAEVHDVPQSSMLFFTRRFADQASSEMNIAGWVEVVWPMLGTSNAGHADASGWKATSPSFAALTAPDKDAEEIDKQAFLWVWKKSRSRISWQQW